MSVNRSDPGIFALLCCLRGATSSDGVVFTGYPTAPGEYELFVRLDEDRPSEWRSLDFGEYDTSCLGVKIAIGYIHGNRRGDVSIWKTTNPRECSDENDAADR